MTFFTIKSHFNLQEYKRIRIVFRQYLTILTMINSTKRSIANLQKSYLDHEIMKLRESIQNIVGHEKLIMTDFLRNGMSLYIRECNLEF